jgi:hypothetical protein
MDQPKGIVQEEKQHIMCKLKKTLYGLKQFPRAWYHSINSFFINKGFCRIQADHLLYVKQMGGYW